MLLQALTAPEATVIAASVGAIAGLTGGVLAAVFQRRLENAKWPRTREDALAADLRTSMAGLIGDIAAGLHAICWLTWDLDQRPDSPSAERVAEYDADMHRLLPRLLGGLAAVAAIDGKATAELRPMVETIIDVDYRIGVAMLQLQSDPEGAREGLRAEYQRGRDIEHDLPRRVVEIVSRAVEDRAVRLRSAGRVSRGA